MKVLSDYESLEGWELGDLKRRLAEMEEHAKVCMGCEQTCGGIRNKFRVEIARREEGR